MKQPSPSVIAKKSVMDFLEWAENNNYSQKTVDKLWDAYLIVCNARYDDC